MRIVRKIVLTVVVSVILLTGIGISYAWFTQRAAMSTLLNIIPPDFIDIIPVDSPGGMLDLDFKEGIDSKDEVTGDVTIRRPVCIKSTSPVHQLEIVHTTNLNNLTFAIYPTTKVDGGVLIPDEDAKSISGAYKNESVSGSKLAKQETLKNYQSTDDVADVHAYPLYWLAENSGDGRYVDDADTPKIQNRVESYTERKTDPNKQVEKTYYDTYYYLEIHWREPSKETDLFYIIARNIAVTEKEGSVSTP